MNTDRILTRAIAGTTADRIAIHAYVSAEAHGIWHAFAAINGVTVSGLLEGLAPELELEPTTSTAPIRARLHAAVIVGRKIDAARRRRTP